MRTYLISAEPPFTDAVFVRDVTTYEDVAIRIRKFRKKSFKITKPLNVANSSLECYLANILKADPFPGDIDLAIFKGAIISQVAEFKTHNLPTGIANESFDKYKDKDWR